MAAAAFDDQSRSASIQAPPQESRQESRRESSRRFHSAAAHYLDGRPPYAALLVRRVATLVGLGAQQHAVLDLGCGPAPLARAFAPLAGTVVAMDPEPEMLRIAAERCAGIGNIRLVPGGSDTLSPALGRFRLVAMGRSFHWMDRAATLQRLDAMIDPAGAVVLFQTHHAEVPDNAWTQEFRTLRRHYAADDSGHPDPQQWRHEAVLLDSPFGCLEAHTVFTRREMAAGQLIDRAFSMSSTAPARLGTARAAALQRDITALIRKIAPEGRLIEVVESTALVARRRGEDAVP